MYHFHLNFQIIKSKQHLVQNIIQSTNLNRILYVCSSNMSTFKYIKIFPEEYKLKKRQEIQQGVMIYSLQLNQTLQAMTWNS